MVLGNIDQAIFLFRSDYSMEIHVANLIKSGKSNKEISQFLNSSIHTISRHRENIRKKTGLKNSKTNLRTFLLTLEENLF